MLIFSETMFWMCVLGWLPWLGVHSRGQGPRSAGLNLRWLTYVVIPIALAELLHVGLPDQRPDLGLLGAAIGSALVYTGYFAWVQAVRRITV